MTLVTRAASREFVRFIVDNEIFKTLKFLFQQTAYGLISYVFSFHHVQDGTGDYKRDYKPLAIAKTLFIETGCTVLFPVEQTYT